MEPWEETVKSEFADIGDRLGLPVQRLLPPRSGCAVRDAIRAGASEERLAHYRRVLEDAEKSRAGQDRNLRTGRKFRPASRRVDRMKLLEEALEDDEWV